MGLFIIELLQIKFKEFLMISSKQNYEIKIIFSQNSNLYFKILWNFKIINNEMYNWTIFVNNLEISLSFLSKLFFEKKFYLREV